MLKPYCCQAHCQRQQCVFLVDGLLATVVYNQNRQQNRVRIFESGLRFYDISIPGFRQDSMLAGVICGNRYEEHWNLERDR